jgi:hypothetical protein
MPRHHPRPARPPDLERLALDLAELLDGIDLSTPIRRDHGGRRDNRPDRWDSHHSGLLTLLEQELEPGGGARTGAGSGKGKPSSRAPVRNDILALLTSIEAGTTDMRWRAMRTLGRKREWRELPVRAGLRALETLMLDLAPAEPLRHEVCAQVRRWVGAAQVSLSFVAPMARLEAICPYCGEATLTVRSDATSDVWCANDECRDDEGREHRWPRGQWVLLLGRMTGSGG